MKKLFISIISVALFIPMFVSATTFYFSTYVGGEIAHSFGGTTSPNKATYSPGESITLNGNVNITYDVGVGCDSRASFSFGWLVDSNFKPVYDGFAWVTGAPAFLFVDENLFPACLGIDRTGSQALLIPSDMSAGSHYIRLRAIGSTMTTAGVQLAQSIEYVDVPFNVAATCVAGWGSESLVYDGWAGTGPGWCNGTSYGACAVGTTDGSNQASAKGSVDFCCRGADNLGYLRTCAGSAPPPATVKLCFGAVCP